MGECPSPKENQPTCFAFFKGDFPKRNACDYGHPLESAFHQKGNCKFGSNCTFKNTDKAGDEPKKRHNSLVVAKTLDLTQADCKITLLKIIAKGSFLHRVLAVPSKLGRKWSRTSDWLPS